MSSIRKRLLYIFPSNFEHSGISVKVKGQLLAFQTRYKTTCISVLFSRKSPKLIQWIAGIFFEIQAVLYSPFYTVIYCRYNPKTPFITLWIGLLSFIKPVYIEHNTLLSNELLFLGRTFENKLHHFLMRILKYSNVQHIAVNHELLTHLRTIFSVKETHSLYLQNGFLMPFLNKSKIDLSKLHFLANAKKPHQKLAIFCGNGYPWHGLDTILSLIKQNPNVFLIIVGPYDRSSQIPENAILAGKLSIDTLYSLYKICDFAISTFRWDMLGIHEGSPLKTREYLCFGLPILVNYYDCAEDFAELKPYVFNYSTSKNALGDISTFSYNKDALSLLSQQTLAWHSIWKGTLL